MIPSAGNATASNPVARIIPCHRVIRASGVLGEYRWGRGRKLAMLSLEAGGDVRAPIDDLGRRKFSTCND